MTETVTVPRELLQRVLHAAWADSYSAQECAKWADDVPLYEADRARINELRKAAGLDE